MNNLKPLFDMELVLLLFIFVLAAFLGFELIAKVPSQLHPPLMSGSNAISGITIVGALLAAGAFASSLARGLGLAALFLATVTLVSGFPVTGPLLALFKVKGDEED